MSIQPEPRNVIYGLSCTCHPEKGVRYVGQTCQGIKARMGGHRHAARGRSLNKWDNNLPVHNWMRKHGIENVHCEILEVVDDPDDLDEAEEIWIGLHRTYRGSGLNLTVGGGGVRGVIYSDEALENIRRARRAPRAPISDETRLRMSESRRGESHGRATLTDADVATIKWMIWEGSSNVEVSQEFGIHLSKVGHISAGHTWTHVPWPIGPRCIPAVRGVPHHRERGSEHKDSKLTESDVIEIRRRASEGERQIDIARDYPVLPANIARIVNRQTWKHVA